MAPAGRPVRDRLSRLQALAAGLVPSLARRELLLLSITASAVLVAGFGGSALVLSLPAVTFEFHAGEPAAAQLGSALRLGALLAVPLAIASDRRGRRPFTILAVAGFTAANLGSALAPNLAWLTGARLIAVAFEGLMLALGVALMVEEFAPDRRAFAVGLLSLAWGAGTGLDVLLWPLIAPRWRLLFGIAAAAGATDLPLLFWWLRPSQRPVVTRVDPGALRVLAARPWRRRLLVLGVSSVLTAAFLAPGNLFIALYGTRLGLVPAQISEIMLAAGASAIPVFLLFARWSDLRGRRLLVSTITALTGLAGLLTYSGSTTGYWIGNIAWSLLSSAAAPALGAWTGELFPARARATAETLVAVAAATGGIVGNQFLGLASTWIGLGSGLGVLAGVAVAGGLALLLLPETRRQSPSG